MDLDRMESQERLEWLAEICNMYFNEGKTQIEIAKAIDSTRFKVARWLQEAKNENVVNISVYAASRRSAWLEKELQKKYDLKDAIVINSKFLSYPDTLRDLGKLGADYIDKCIKKESVVGLTWGKTLQSLVSQVPVESEKGISVLQLAGAAAMNNPASDSIDLVRTLATSYNGTCHFLYQPLYVNERKILETWRSEPLTAAALRLARRLDVVVTGIGGKSSLPTHNPVWAPYTTDKDRAADLAGSIYGRLLDKNGDVADIPLNHKLIAVDFDLVCGAVTKILIVLGRHKIESTRLGLRRQYANVLITDIETANGLLNE